MDAIVSTNLLRTRLNVHVSDLVLRCRDAGGGDPPVAIPRIPSSLVFVLQNSRTLRYYEKPEDTAIRQVFRHCFGNGSGRSSIGRFGVSSSFSPAKIVGFGRKRGRGTRVRAVRAVRQSQRQPARVLGRRESGSRCNAAPRGSRQSSAHVFLAIFDAIQPSKSDHRSILRGCKVAISLGFLPGEHQSHIQTQFVSLLARQCFRTPIRRSRYQLSYLRQCGGINTLPLPPSSITGSHPDN